MSISDIIKETSEKSKNKNLAGDTIMHGVVVGIVVENGSRDFAGMVRVKIPTRDKNKNVLQWMKVVSTMGGKAWGSYVIPEIGDQVLVAFEEGNINNAYVIGSIYKNNSSTVGKYYTDENYKKVFKTKGGNRIEIDDTDDKQSISLVTKNGHTVSMDDASSTITISDKDKGNMMRIDTRLGFIDIKTGNKIAIEVNGAKFEMIGGLGMVNLNCVSFNVNAAQSISLAAGGGISVTAMGAMQLKAVGATALTSEAVMQLKGTLIKLGI